MLFNRAPPRCCVVYRCVKITRNNSVTYLTFLISFRIKNYTAEIVMHFNYFDELSRILSFHNVKDGICLTNSAKHQQRVNVNGCFFNGLNLIDVFIF